MEERSGQHEPRYIFLSFLYMDLYLHTSLYVCAFLYIYIRCINICVWHIVFSFPFLDGNLIARLSCISKSNTSLRHRICFITWNMQNKRNCVCSFFNYTPIFCIVQHDLLDKNLRFPVNFYWNIFVLVFLLKFRNLASILFSNGKFSILVNEYWRFDL